MQVYLASKFSMKNEVREHAEELREAGIGVTSRWLDEESEADDMTEYASEYLIEHALMDLVDIDRADMLVLFTVDPNTPTKRGGRHVESGYMIGIAGADNLIVVGPRENIFHYLPGVRQFDTWEAAKQFLIDQNGAANGLHY